jgi:ParB family chromosome partitioning protein
MSKAKRHSEIKTIPIDKINILNPRARSKKIFEMITDNIAQVGLKKPITVTTCKSGAAGKEYDLVCGQGRLEAFMACGQTHIPAMVIDATEEQALLMSLVENLARRQHRAPDLLHAIEILRKQGYNIKTISEKTGLTDSYVDGILRLMQQGEQRLMAAVENGQIPLTVAIQIADTPDENIQRLLQSAYESKELRGQRLIQTRRLLEQRKLRGKSFQTSGATSGYNRRPQRAVVSVQDVMKVYQKDVDRKKLLTRKANRTSEHLLLVVMALQKLFKEDHFNVLLKAEKLNTVPKPVSDLLAAKGSSHG